MFGFGSTRSSLLFGLFSGYDTEASHSRDSLVAELGLQGSCASMIAVPRLESTGSVAAAHGLICAAAHGTFPDQELNPCLLHWQADSLPRSHQGSPCGI